MKYKSFSLLWLAVTITLMMIAFGYDVYAESIKDKENEINEMIDGISGSLDDYYDEVIDIESIKNGDFAVQGKTIISILVTLMMGSFAGNVIKLCGAILLSCVLSRIADLCEGKLLAQSVKVIKLFFTVAVCYSLVNDLFVSVQKYTSSLDTLMTSYSFVLSEILLFGGNMSLASVSATVLTFILEITRKLTLTVLVPIIKICFSVSIASSVTSSDRIKYIADFFKKIFVTLSVAFMTVLTIIMSFQSYIASAADSVAMRSVKFAAANTVPIIGGLVSETFRTLGSAVSLFKGSAGMVGIICLLAITVIPVAHLLGIKYCFAFGESFSSFLGADCNKTVLSDCSGLINYLIGTVVITTVYFAYYIYLFADLACAVGG